MGKTFAIGDRLDEPTQQTIADIPDTTWTHYVDCAVAETLHSMNARTKPSGCLSFNLFNDKPRYHVIASNRDETTAATLLWYRQRGETSENGIKELKLGFGMERMPCGQSHANAAFFRVGVITHNLFVHLALGPGWQRHKVATVRWRLFHVPGKVRCHAGAWMLKTAPQTLDTFRAIRARRQALA